MKLKLHHLYILTTSIAMLMYFGLDRSPMPWWYSSMHCIIWTILGMIVLNKQGIKELFTGPVKSIFYLFGVPYIFYWMSTLFAWVINGYIQPNTISRSISLTNQYMLIVIYVIVVAKVFKNELLKYTFQAAVINNIIVIMFAIVRWGIKNFITVGLVPLSEYASSWTLENLNISAFLEVHDITFAFGFFLIYFFLFHDEPNKRKNVIICVVFIYLGLKRIQLAALFVVIGLSVLIKGKSRYGIKFWSVVVTACSLMGALTFIWLIDSNMITELVAVYNINFSGRLRVYYNLSKYFSFGPSYFGHGMAFGRIIASDIACYRT